MNLTDTIAAISTPYGRGGIAVIRICGDKAIEYASKVFVPFGKEALNECGGGRFLYGRIFFNGDQIDDGVASVFRAPRSYTGEDTVEISCHGGIALSAMVLESLLLAGCRSASAGEFTKRAYLNGKLSLTQAEAVIGLIDAQTEDEIKLTSAQSRGVLAEKISSVSKSLTEIIASIYAYIDYPDEDLTEYSCEDIKASAEKIISELKSLESTYRLGKAICEGIPTAIIGKPNTGKSSLLNMLVGSDRAIVTDIPGTTRDTIEESVSLGSIKLRLCDTAGIHETNETVEQLGIDRSRKIMENAELILAVFDGSREADADDLSLIAHLKSLNKAIIPVINKSDLEANFDSSLIADIGNLSVISTVTQEGKDDLINRIQNLYSCERIDYSNDPIIANARQHTALLSAIDCLVKAVDSIANGFTQDIAGVDMELALSKLNEVDGRSVSEQITNEIFSRFCVGK